MYIEDFIFDTQRLSSFNCTVVSFDNSGTQTIALSGDCEFVTGQSQSGVNYMYGSKYTGALSATISIVKNNGDFFSYDELAKINKWLVRTDNYYRFEPITDDNSLSTIYYMVNFTVSTIILASKIIGLELKINTDRPWANVDKEQTILLTPMQTATLLNKSDRIGQSPMWMQIVTNTNGDITITNKLTKNDITITECISGEKITIDGELMIINSTKSNLSKRFNWNYPTIGTSPTSNENIITSTLPCSILCRWTERRGVGIFA